MKDKYIRLKSLLLAGTIFISGASLTGCSSRYSDSPEQSVVEECTKTFGVGEHIISVPINSDVRTNNTVYDYHPGYEVIGISLTSYGRVSNNFGGGAILYQNIEEVECSGVRDYRGNVEFLDFGKPKVVKVEEELDGSTKEFAIGEHIISVPIMDDNRLENISYEYHEGYEVVGFATTAYGRVSNNFGNGVILYKNIVPVSCSLEDGGYTSFGIPSEVKKVMSYK